MAFYNFYAKSDAWSVSALGQIINNFQNRYFLKLIKKYSVSTRISLLEIGPGQGAFADVCNREEGIDYCAIEANGDFCELLKNNNYRVYNYSVPPIDLDEKFDVIFMNQIFEHMKDVNQALALISSCKEHLNEQGVLIISSPDILAVKEDFFAMDYSHNYPTSKERLSQIYLDNDIQVLYSDYYAFTVRGYVATRILAFSSRLFYGLGLFKLIFPRKAYKIKISLLPSCLVVGRKV